MRQGVVGMWLLICVGMVLEARGDDKPLQPSGRGIKSATQASAISPGTELGRRYRELNGEHFQRLQAAMFEDGGSATPDPTLWMQASKDRQAVLRALVADVESRHLNPLAFRDHVALASACIHLGRYADSVRHAGAAIQQRPGDPRPYPLLIVSLLAQGQLAEAETTFQKAVQRFPKSPVVRGMHYMLAAAQSRTGDRLIAAQHLASYLAFQQQLLSQAPAVQMTFADGVRQMVDAYLAADQPQEARAHLERQIEAVGQLAARLASPELDVLHAKLRTQQVDLLSDLGQREQANHLLESEVNRAQEALEGDPDSPNRARVLALLRLAQRRRAGSETIPAVASVEERQGETPNSSEQNPASASAPSEVGDNEPSGTVIPAGGAEAPSLPAASTQELVELIRQLQAEVGRLRAEVAELRRAVGPQGRLEFLIEGHEVSFDPLGTPAFLAGEVVLSVGGSRYPIGRYEEVLTPALADGQMLGTTGLSTFTVYADPAQQIVAGRMTSSNTSIICGGSATGYILVRSVGNIVQADGIFQELNGQLTSSSQIRMFPRFELQTQVNFVVNRPVEGLLLGLVQQAAASTEQPQRR